VSLSNEAFVSRYSLEIKLRFDQSLFTTYVFGMARVERPFRIAGQQNESNDDNFMFFMYKYSFKYSFRILVSVMPNIGEIFIDFISTMI
jgi:hypothetical protein